MKKSPLNSDYGLLVLTKHIHTSCTLQMICASFLPILSAGQLPWISFFPMISFRCQLSGSPVQSGWTVPLCTTLPHSGTSEAPGCIRGEPGQPSAHSTYCVPDRFQILTHSSMTMEQRTNMSKSTYFVCMEEPWTLTCNVHLFIPFLIFSTTRVP